MNKKPEKFLLFTTDGVFEFVPEAEADTAERILSEYVKHSKENKYAQYMILCPDGIVRSQYEVHKHYLVKHEKQFFEEIPGSKRIYQFDGIGAAAVYLGWLTDLTPAAVKWRQDDESLETAEICGGEPDFITLNEIAEQFPDQMITVIIDDPLDGEIYNYGNHGKKWLRVGFTGGYA